MPTPTGSEEIFTDHASARKRLADKDITNVPSKIKSLILKTLPMKDNWKHIEIKSFFKGLSLVLISDLENEGQEKCEMASFVFDNVVCKAVQTEVNIMFFVLTPFKCKFLFRI